MWLITGGKTSHRTNITIIYSPKYIKKLWRIVFNEISKTVWNENFVCSDNFMNMYKTKKRGGTPVSYIPFNTKIPSLQSVKKNFSLHLPDKMSSIKIVHRFNTT